MATFRRLPVETVGAILVFETRRRIRSFCLAINCKTCSFTRLLKFRFHRCPTLVKPTSSNLVDDLGDRYPVQSCRVWVELNSSHPSEKGQSRQNYTPLCSLTMTMTMARTTTVSLRRTRSRSRKETAPSPPPSPSNKNPVNDAALRQILFELWSVPANRYCADCEVELVDAGDAHALVHDELLQRSNLLKPPLAAGGAFCCASCAAAHASQRLVKAVPELQLEDVVLLRQTFSSEDDESSSTFSHHYHQRLIELYAVVAPDVVLTNGRTELAAGWNDWTDVPLTPTMQERCECHTGSNVHSDFSYPEHVPLMVFPEGCAPVFQPKEPEFFALSLTTGTGERLYGGALKIWVGVDDWDDWYRERLNQALFKGKETGLEQPILVLEQHKRQRRRVVYLPKCLVLLSHHPFFDLWRTFLLQLYQVQEERKRVNPVLPINMERFIDSFCAKTPLPVGSPECCWQYGLYDTTRYYQSPKAGPPVRLPLANFSYQPLFACLSISNVLTLWACLLQETRVVFTSKHYALLCPVAEALTSLMFPFQWQGLYLPVLPETMLEVLDAPVPYLCGVHARCLLGDDATIPRHQWPRGVVVCDLDDNVVHLGYSDDDKTPRSVPHVPEQLVRLLKSQLMECGASSVYLSTNDSHAIWRLTQGEGQPVPPSFTGPTSYAHTTNTHRKKGPLKGLAPGVGSLNPPSSIHEDRSLVLSRVDQAFVEISKKASLTNIESMLSTGRRPMLPHRGRIHSLRESFKPSAPSRVSPASGTKQHLLDLVEPVGFDTVGIRSAFLRFFVTLFQDYRAYRLKNHGFRREDFVLNVVGRRNPSAAYMRRVLESQMFDSFLQERRDFPNDQQVRLFDEAIRSRRRDCK